MSLLDKKRQSDLFIWLKRQVKQHKKLLSLSIIAGFFSALCIVVQAALLAIILQKLIMDDGTFSAILPYFIGLIALFILRALLAYAREQVNFMLGLSIRKQIRQQIIDKLEHVGPVVINQQTTGGWSTLLIEQVDDLQEFYARYLPQMRLATMIPILILVVIVPFNWAAALILFCTAPLIPLFMILVGMGAADINRKNFKALAHLSGHFLDRLKGLETIKLFNQGAKQSDEISHAAEGFSIRTMRVLKVAFLSSAVLEFFASISIAIVAVYFGFSYLGQFDFGSYSGGVTLFAGFFALILAPEFFQPLRDLGTYYHAKAQAIAAADNIDKFINKEQNIVTDDNRIVINQKIVSISAKDLVILSPNNIPLVGPISFTITAPFRLGLIGKSGEGKSSLFNLLLGFLPYQGSLQINDIEFNRIDINVWRQQLSWIGQNPYLLNASIRENILLGKTDANQQELQEVINQSQLASLINALPHGLDTVVGEDAVRLSIGQAQRIAIARALLKPCQILLLDEPTASLDKQTAQEIEQILLLSYQSRQVITITHQTDDFSCFDRVWQLADNTISIIKDRIDERK